MPSATTSAPQRSARSRSVRTTSSEASSDGAALDERQVDLDDVERSWLSRRRPAFPAPDVVGGDADAGDAAGLDRAAQPVDVLDRLALGQLEDDPCAGRARGGRSSGASAWTLNSSISSVRGDRLTVSDPGQAQPGDAAP